MAYNKYRGKHWNRRSYNYYYSNGKKESLILDSFRIDIYNNPKAKGAAYYHKDSTVVYFKSAVHPQAKYSFIASYVAECWTDKEILEDISTKIYRRFSLDIVKKIHKARKLCAILDQSL
jgi:hypothetical protein